MWHFRGTPAHLDIHAARLGLSPAATARARHNAEIHRVSTLLGQLCERYHRAPKDPDGRAVVWPAELGQIRGTLGQVEDEAAKLRALADSARSMIDEARVAFGLPRGAADPEPGSGPDEPSAADAVPVRLRPDSPRGRSPSPPVREGAAQR